MVEGLESKIGGQNFPSFQFAVAFEFFAKCNAKFYLKISSKARLKLESPINVCVLALAIYVVLTKDYRVNP